MKKQCWKFLAIYYVALLVFAGVVISSWQESSKAPQTKEEPRYVQRETPAPKQSAPQEPRNELRYTRVTIKQLTDALEANAARAQNDFNGQYVEVAGVLGNIDSDGNYFALDERHSRMEFVLTNIHCRLKNEQQRRQLLSLNKGQAITVYGQITHVGDILGYTIDVTEIK